MNKITSTAVATMALWLFNPVSLLAQASSESPYSSSESGEIANPSPWFESPIVLIGLVIFGIVVVYLIFKGINRKPISN